MGSMDHLITAGGRIVESLWSRFKVTFQDRCGVDLHEMSGVQSQGLSFDVSCNSNSGNYCVFRFCLGWLCKIGCSRGTDFALTVSAYSIYVLLHGWLPLFAYESIPNILRHDTCQNFGFCVFILTSKVFNAYDGNLQFIVCLLFHYSPPQRSILESFGEWFRACVVVVHLKKYYYFK